MCDGEEEVVEEASAASMGGMSASESATCRESTSSTVVAPVRFMCSFHSKSVDANVRTRDICSGDRYDAMSASVSTDDVVDDASPPLADRARFRGGAGGKPPRLRFGPTRRGLGRHHAAGGGARADADAIARRDIAIARCRQDACLAASDARRIARRPRSAL